MRMISVIAALGQLVRHRRRGGVDAVIGVACGPEVKRAGVFAPNSKYRARATPSEAGEVSVLRRGMGRNRRWPNAVHR